jgi:predicted Fe-Mo cluster-binding NifX family protein
MKICFPTLEDSSFESRVSDHFGQAVYFINVDTETNAIEVIDGSGSRHNTDDINLTPLDVALSGGIDAIVVSGIGLKAITRLSDTNVKVYRKQGATITENIDAFKSGSLEELSFDEGCRGDGS